LGAGDRDVARRLILVSAARRNLRTKLANYFGLTIGRILAMPGVMRYDGDRIVDLSATE
jgi:hypothetical protein